MKLQVESFGSETEWARGIADRWQERLTANPALRHCLAAGLTPVRIYAEMLRRVREGSARFGDARIFLLDEYGGLAPDDPGRCANMLRRFLVDHLDLPPSAFFTPSVDAPDLDAACREYDATIGGGFDLVLLGIGTNGHVGMNEPGTPVDIDTHRAGLHVETVTSSARYMNHDRFPTWGLTIGLRPLLAAREVWLLATGAAKAGIVARLLAEEAHSDLPASWFRDHPNARLFLDRAAAGDVLA